MRKVGRSVNEKLLGGTSFPAKSSVRSRIDMMNFARRAHSKQPPRSPRPLSRRSAARLPWLLGLITAIGWLGTSTQSEAAKIRGKIAGFRLLRNPVWMEAQDPARHLFSFREAVPTVPSEVRQLYPHIPKEICVAAIAASPQKAPPPVLIRIGGGRTTPVTIVVPPMTQLSFQNTDPFPHKIYGVGIATFTASETGRGANRDWTVPAAGTYEIRDEAAPSLRMWVIAEPNVAAIAYPSLRGDFALNLTEPGDYQVQAYFAGKPVGPATTVTVDQQDVEMKAPVAVAKSTDKPSDGKPSDGKPSDGKPVDATSGKPEEK